MSAEQMAEIIEGLKDGHHPVRSWPTAMPSAERYAAQAEVLAYLRHVARLAMFGVVGGAPYS
jgi:hypothetical protein